MKNFLVIIIAALIQFTPLHAGEGMWLPLFLKSLNEAEMKSMGMKLNAEDIYSVNKGSLKDAIVHFGGGCSSSIISPNGLLLTNHHCGYSQIQSHSTVENNRLRDGFWAKDYSEELPNPGLFATFIDRIEDISKFILAGVTSGMTAAQRQSQVDKNINEYRKNNPVGKFQNIIIRPFFEGNQYFAFFTTTYNDVRLVGTPPESIGKFGADTDNWEWPRHTGDFALFRIYATPDNQPADYDEANVPYTPKHFLPVSIDGVEEGDFTLIFGFPGRTNQYLPSPAISQIIDYINPARIKIRDKSLAVMDKYMRADEATKIQYASKFASIANAWKKWKGESLGLVRTNAIDKKNKFETDFNKRAVGKPHYYRLLSEFESNYKSIDEISAVREYFMEITQRNVDTYRQIFVLKRLVDAYKENGVNGYKTMLERIKPGMMSYHDRINYRIDAEMGIELVDIYLKNVATQYHPPMLQNFSKNKNESDAALLQTADYFMGSFLAEQGSIDAMLEESPENAVLIITNDKLYQFIISWAELINENVDKTFMSKKTVLDSLQTVYMTAQMELFPEKRFYPDANSTMRITYGNVEGFYPRDAVSYTPVSYLEGVMEKYVPGDYEFDVPEKLRDLYHKKDYGQYADKTGRVPVCFLGSNHTTGGNSGSSAIDAYGNLIGLNFDRVWEGTMSDINYDRSICRNIMVDSRYILFIVDKFAGADHLIKEMKIVRPKTKVINKK